MNIEPYRQILERNTGDLHPSGHSGRHNKIRYEGKDTLGLMPTGGGKSLTFPGSCFGDGGYMPGNYSSYRPDERSGQQAEQPGDQISRRYIQECRGKK
jgi:hypothetical protein